MVDRPDDSEMTDAVLRSEIELLADLIAAVSDVPGPLTEDQVDAVLGLSPLVPRDDGDTGGAPPAHMAS
jgi:hypothetical protein